MRSEFGRIHSGTTAMEFIVRDLKFWSITDIFVKKLFCLLLTLFHTYLCLLRLLKSCFNYCKKRKTCGHYSK